MQIIPQAQATESWSGSCVSEDVATIQGVGCLIANILSVATSVIGIVAFIMILYAGFNMMLKGGNSQATEKSKNIITYAVIGIIVALSCFIILNLIASFTGVETIKTFEIPGYG
jgi:TRAP-type C4-dicarboxylate transport system permease small subunit